MPSAAIANRSKQNREKQVARAASEPFDVAIIGGGIHGACLAREAALHGLRVLLLEARDFAFGTSSRSSKLLHGGIRYLEQGDIPLVFRALSERAALLHTAPHLTRPQEFLFPVVESISRPAWQIKIGLSLYDLLAQLHGLWGSRATNTKRHHRLAASDPDAKRLTENGLRFSALYSYFDAQMNDARLVIENIIDAESLDAVVLNQARLEQVTKIDNVDDCWKLRWHCGMTHFEHSSRARYLVNLAGPWAPQVHQLIGVWPSEWPQPIFSRGTHLLFDAPWEGPALILPTGEPGRYYFVLPYFSACGGGTLVGTTDHQATANEDDPIAPETEIAELLGYLARDLPHSGLDRNLLCETFAGMRILAGQPAERMKRSSALSRDEVLLQNNRYLLMLGGKYTTARFSAQRIVRKLAAEIGSRSILRQGREGSDLRKFPGAVSWTCEHAVKLAEKLCAGSAKQDATLLLEAQRAVARFGMRAAQLLDPPFTADAGEERAADRLFRAQVRFAVLTEHAQTVEDVLRRRLGVSVEPTITAQEQERLIKITEEELIKLHNNIN